MTPPSDPRETLAVARWAAEVTLDDPERRALWLQVARGGVAWLRTTGRMPSGSSASGCSLAAIVDYERARKILRSEHGWECWTHLSGLARELQRALDAAEKKPD